MKQFSLRAGAALALTWGGMSIASAECGLDVDPASMDADWNGELSRGETADSVLEPVFDQIDRNGDGVIGQPEFAGRCAALEANAEPSVSKVAQEAAADKAARQAERQQGRAERRLDRETDRAVDSLVDKTMNKLFD